MTEKEFNQARDLQREIQKISDDLAAWKDPEAKLIEYTHYIPESLILDFIRNVVMALQQRLDWLEEEFARI